MVNVLAFKTGYFGFESRCSYFFFYSFLLLVLLFMLSLHKWLLWFLQESFRASISTSFPWFAIFEFQFLRRKYEKRWQESLKQIFASLRNAVPKLRLISSVAFNILCSQIIHHTVFLCEASDIPKKTLTFLCEDFLLNEWRKYFGLLT